MEQYVPVETTSLCCSAIHEMDRAGFTLVYRLSVLTSTLTVMTTCMLASRHVLFSIVGRPTATRYKKTLRRQRIHNC